MWLSRLLRHAKYSSAGSFCDILMWLCGSHTRWDTPSTPSSVAPVSFSWSSHARWDTPSTPTLVAPCDILKLQKYLDLHQEPMWRLSVDNVKHSSSSSRSRDRPSVGLGGLFWGTTQNTTSPKDLKTSLSRGVTVQRLDMGGGNIVGFGSCGRKRFNVEERTGEKMMWCKTDGVNSKQIMERNHYILRIYHSGKQIMRFK